MFRNTMRSSLHLAFGTLIVVGSLFTYQAQATDVGREWDRGCEDAKGGSYDRSRHSEAYESGWNACKEQQKQAAPAEHKSTEHHSKEWQRGCDDAKGGSYDRSRHSQAYESGWQKCKKN